MSGVYKCNLSLEGKTLRKDVYRHIKDEFEDGGFLEVLQETPDGAWASTFIEQENIVCIYMEWETKQ